MLSIERIKERKLVQWALAYLAGAWLLLQELERCALRVRECHVGVNYIMCPNDHEGRADRFPKCLRELL